MFRELPIWNSSKEKGGGEWEGETTPFWYSKLVPKFCNFFVYKVAKNPYFVCPSSQTFQFLAISSPISDTGDENERKRGNRGEKSAVIQHFNAKFSQNDDERCKTLFFNISSKAYNSLKIKFNRFEKTLKFLCPNISWNIQGTFSREGANVRVDCEHKFFKFSEGEKRRLTKKWRKKANKIPVTESTFRSLHIKFECTY